MIKLKTTDKDFAKKLQPTVAPDTAPQILAAVKQISDAVIAQGDAAIIAFTNKFDGTNAKSIADLKVSQDEIEAAYKEVKPEVIEALKTAAARIESYHKKQMPVDIDYTDDEGVRLGNIWKAINRVGIYVPGGQASYPSSVLMNAIPAKTAGVKEIIMVVPTREGQLNPVVLAAAKICGITEIYKIGGAQAIAALSFPNNSVPSVDKIVGPGNAYVAAAKRYFYGTVGIDMIAGPSEILVVADNKNNPDWIAADLLSQAEHDENARSILVTFDEKFADSVIKSVENTLKNLDRADIARQSWEDNGVVVVAKDEADAIRIIDAIAPEHLELALDDDVANKMVGKISNAGAIFLGRYTPEAIGDYTAGPSHVLPTSGTARFSSGLSVYDFLKRMSLIGCTQDSFNNLAKATADLADEEGLGAHALSVRVRTNR